MALTILYSKLYKLLKYSAYCQDIRWFAWKKLHFKLFIGKKKKKSVSCQKLFYIRASFWDFNMNHKTLKISDTNNSLGFE